MKPSRELDTLVAEKVMGWSLGCNDGKSNRSPSSGLWSRGRNPMEGVPYYSTDVAAAFEIVHQLETNGWGLILDNMEHYLGNWQAHFEKDGRAVSSEGGSAPHAICLAALKALNAS